MPETVIERATTAWSNDELRKVAAADDLHVSPFRDDGVTYGTPTWIWSVVVDDAVYVRAYNGKNSRWYQAAMRQKAGRIAVADMTKEVAFEPINGRCLDLWQGLVGGEHDKRDQRSGLSPRLRARRPSPYAIPNLRVELTTTDVGIPVLWWRAVGSTHTAYAVEAFLDEVAEAAGKDPVALRLGLLKDHPRHAGVLRLAAQKAGWDRPLSLRRQPQQSVPRGRALCSGRPVGRYEVEVLPCREHMPKTVARGEHEPKGSGRLVEHVEPAPAKCGHKQFGPGECDSGRGPCVGARLKYRLFHSGPLFVSRYRGPAVIGSRPDEIDLVTSRLSVFGDEQAARAIPGKSLRVTVTVRVDVGTCERVVRGHLAVPRHAQDFAGQTAEVLREFSTRRPPRGDIQMPVRTDGEAPTIVQMVARDPVE